MATVLIKKYGNRRLYNTALSKYVTLDELADTIRNGADVRVVDAETSDDLTQATLVQIVMETRTAKYLPAQLLMQMIRLGDDAMAEFFSRYVTGALDLYLQAKTGVATAYGPLAQIPIAAQEALTRMWMNTPFAAQYQPSGYTPQGFPPAYPQQPQYAPPSPYVAPPPPAEDADEPQPRKRADTEPVADQRDDVAAMRRELDELKAAIRESLPKRKPKKR